MSDATMAALNGGASVDLMEMTQRLVTKVSTYGNNVMAMVTSRNDVVHAVSEIDAAVFGAMTSAKIPRLDIPAGIFAGELGKNGSPPPVHHERQLVPLRQLFPDDNGSPGPANELSEAEKARRASYLARGKKAAETRRKNGIEGRLAGARTIAAKEGRRLVRDVIVDVFKKHPGPLTTLDIIAGVELETGTKTSTAAVVHALHSLRKDKILAHHGDAVRGPKVKHVMVGPPS